MDVNEIIYNKVTGDSMEFFQTSKSSKGKVTEFNLTLASGSKWAKWPRHFHSHQVETFKVLSGELNLTAGSKHYLLKPGDPKVIVEKFMLHSFWNASDKEVIFRAEIFSPRNVEKGLRATYTLANQGKVNKNNIPYNPFYILILMSYIDSYFPVVPWKLQRLFFASGAKLSNLLGYKLK